MTTVLSELTEIAENKRSDDPPICNIWKPCSAPVMWRYTLSGCNHFRYACQTHKEGWERKLAEFTAIGALLYCRQCDDFRSADWRWIPIN